MAYNDDQAEIDAMSSSMANMDGDSTPSVESELNSNINGLRTTISSLGQQVGAVARSVGQVAAKETGFDKSNAITSIGTMAGGPIGAAVANALQNSGLGEKITTGFKNSISTIASKFRKSDSQSGMIDPASMSRISSNSTREIAGEIRTGISQPLVTANRIAQEELNETRRGNDDIVASVRQFQRSETVGTDSLNNTLERIEGTIRESDSETLEQILNSINNVSTKFDTGKQENPLFSLVKSFFFASRIGTLFRGKYTNDIEKSSNPLETQVSALLQIYRWQRLYGELTKRQLNQLIKLQGGSEQDVVGKYGLLKEIFLKNRTSIKKGLGDKHWYSPGRLLDLITYDEESFDDRNRAAMSAGIGEYMKEKHGKLGEDATFFKYFNDGKNSAQGMADRVDNLTFEETQAIQDRLSKRFDNFESVANYTNYIQPELNARKDDEIYEQQQKIIDDLEAKIDKLTAKKGNALTLKKIQKFEAKIQELQEELDKAKKKQEEVSIDRRNIREGLKLRKGRAPSFYDSVKPEEKKQKADLYSQIKNPFKEYSNVEKIPTDTNSISITPETLWNPNLKGIIPGTVPVTVMGYGTELSNIPNKLKAVLKADGIPNEVIESEQSSAYIQARNHLDQNDETADLRATAKATKESADILKKIYNDDQEDEEEEEKRRIWERAKRIKEEKLKGGLTSKVSSAAGGLSNLSNIILPIAGTIAGAMGLKTLWDKINPLSDDKDVKTATKLGSDTTVMAAGSTVGSKAGEVVASGVTKTLAKGVEMLPGGKHLEKLSKVPGASKLSKATKWLGKAPGKIVTKGLGVVDSGIHIYDGIERLSDGETVRGLNQLAGAGTIWMPGGLALSLAQDTSTAIGDKAQAAVQGSLNTKDSVIKVDGKEVVLEGSNKEQRIGDRATITTQHVIGKPLVGQTVNLTSKGIQAGGEAVANIALKNSDKLAKVAPGVMSKLAIKANEKVFDAGAKIATSTGLKTAGKVAGAAAGAITAGLDIADSISRFKEGDKLGGTLAATSAGVSLGLTGAAMAGVLSAGAATGIGLPVAVAIGGAMMLHDIYQGMDDAENADTLSRAQNDMRFLKESGVSQAISDIYNNEDLSNREKVEAIANLYKKWLGKRGKLDYAKEIHLMSQNKEFLKQAKPAFALFDRLVSEGKIDKGAKSSYMLANYDRWKKEQIAAIGPENLARVASIALNDQGFIAQYKENIDALNKADISKDEFNNEIYWLYHKYTKIKSKSAFKDEDKQYYSKIQELYQGNTIGDYAKQAAQESSSDFRNIFKKESAASSRNLPTSYIDIKPNGVVGSIFDDTSSTNKPEVYNIKEVTTNQKQYDLTPVELPGSDRDEISPETNKETVYDHHTYYWDPAIIGLTTRDPKKSGKTTFERALEHKKYLDKVEALKNDPNNENNKIIQKVANDIQKEYSAAPSKLSVINQESKLLDSAPIRSNETDTRKENRIETKKLTNKELNEFIGKLVEEHNGIHNPEYSSKIDKFIQDNYQGGMISKRKLKTYLDSAYLRNTKPQPSSDNSDSNVIEEIGSNQKAAEVEVINSTSEYKQRSSDDKLKDIEKLAYEYGQDLQLAGSYGKRNLDFLISRISDPYKQSYLSAKDDNERKTFVEHANKYFNEGRSDSIQKIRTSNETEQQQPVKMQSGGWIKKPVLIGEEDVEAVMPVKVENGNLTQKMAKSIAHEIAGEYHAESPFGYYHEKSYHYTKYNNPFVSEGPEIKYTNIPDSEGPLKETGKIFAEFGKSLISLPEKLLFGVYDAIKGTAISLANLPNDFKNNFVVDTWDGNTRKISTPFADKPKSVVIENNNRIVPELISNTTPVSVKERQIKELDKIQTVNRVSEYRKANETIEDNLEKGTDKISSGLSMNTNMISRNVNNVRNTIINNGSRDSSSDTIYTPVVATDTFSLFNRV